MQYEIAGLEKEEKENIWRISHQKRNNWLTQSRNESTGHLNFEIMRKKAQNEIFVLLKVYACPNQKFEINLAQILSNWDSISTPFF